MFLSGGFNLKAKYKYIFLVFLIFLTLASCSSDTESTETFDPKSHISEARYDEINLSSLYDYVVSVGNLESSAPNRLELEKSDDGSISRLSLEVVDIESGKAHIASYDSASDIFKIKIDSLNIPREKVFDKSMLESTEALLKKLESEKALSVYFLTEVSSGSIDTDFLQNSDILMLENDNFQNVETLKSPDSETLYFFAVHELDSQEEFPSYFVVDPKKI